ncbi:hypothetical protein IAU60_005456 [Kwoniella sp. DSM 27419]
MRVSRSNAKTYLNLSIAFNILFLIALFFPSHQAHHLIGDKAWSKVEEYGLTGWGGGQGAVTTDVAGGRCTMCDVNPAFCDEVGESNLMRSLAYTGTNNRIRRMLSKLRRGDKLTMGVVGGSVSHGHGLEEPAAYARENFNRIIFDHLNDLFPAANGVEEWESGRAEGKNSYINGAQGGMGSDYFSLCFNEHMPPDVDLVIVELGINDEVLLQNLNNFELLLRGLADMDHQPAILNLQVFALMFPLTANGGDLHFGVAQFYDVPTVSIRNPLLPQVMQNLTLVRDLFHHRVEKDDWTDPTDGIDLRHLSANGHRIMGKLATTYIDTQLCEMDRLEAGLSDAEKADVDRLYPIEPLPRAPLMKKFDPIAVMPKLRPQCFSTNSKKNPLVPSAMEGWRKWNWNDKNYLVADKPGSKISFKVSTNLGQVQLYYLKSYQYGLGSVSCWIDNDKEKAVRINGYWEAPYNIGRATVVGEGLSQGEHTLHCELLTETAEPKGGQEFRIISVMR